MHQIYLLHISHQIIPNSNNLVKLTFTNCLLSRTFCTFYKPAMTMQRILIKGNGYPLFRKQVLVSRPFLNSIIHGRGSARMMGNSFVHPHNSGKF